MSLLLRIIKIRTAWDKTGESQSSDTDDGPADLLLSFETRQNALSVYLVEPTQLDRFVAAYCANRDSVQTLDYVVVNSASLDDLCLQFAETPATLVDQEVNRWHRDMTDLTVGRVARLSLRLRGVGTVVRRFDKEVGQLINRAIEQGVLPADRLKQSLRTDLQKAKYAPR